MRNIIISLILFVFYYTTKSQSFYLYNNTNPFLYNHVKNEVKIIPIHGKDLKVEIDQGTIEKKEDNIYVIEVDSVNKVIVEITQGENKSEIEFRVSNVPDPDIIYISADGFFYKSQIPDSSFHQLKGIVPYFPNYLLFKSDFRSTIKSFIITRINKQGQKESIKNEGEVIFDRVRILLNKAEKGDIYIFSNIVLRMEFNNEIRTIEDKVVNIE